VVIMTGPVATLTVDELAEGADTSTGHISELVAAGLLTPEPDGRHRVGDIHLVRIFDAMVQSGIPLITLAQAVRGGAVSLTYYDRLHPPAGPRSSRAYGMLKAELGDRAGLLAQLYAAFGLAEPEPDTRLERADEALLLAVVEIAGGVSEPDLVLRVVRLLGDTIRRASEAVLGVYNEAASRVYEVPEGAPPMEAWSIEPWLRLTRTAPELGRWLTARHLSNAIDAWCVEGTERYLVLAGYVPPADREPPAVAFVDLTGFTRMAEQRGDETAARIALDFARLAELHAAEHDGRLVKVLGDGVLLRFPAAQPGVEATLSLLGALAEAGLPPGHAGVDAGPIVLRDGDVFGRTVNLAARIADVAQPDALLAPASLAAALPPERFKVAAFGAASLAGISEPVELIRIGFA
jgi:adenylate cyclase